ncbi:hypothetical protein F4604DRAFT_199626 [Suillus subluteus]|nr:hypothetical protein F4604DRAFT_199626 [Suillus subluteus]
MSLALIPPVIFAFLPHLLSFLLPSFSLFFLSCSHSSSPHFRFFAFLVLIPPSFIFAFLPLLLSFLLPSFSLFCLSCSHSSFLHFRFFAFL